MKQEVINIPVSHIRVVNPRHRDKRKFGLVVESIRQLGLKKPIQVTLQDGADGGENWYNLVCGQGRKEAFEVLGYPEIPAVVIEADRTTGMLMSLVENMARRQTSCLDLVQEILRLKSQGLSQAAIGRRLGMSDSLISGLLVLNRSGEERLILEAVNGHIPIGTAIEISKVENPQQQREFLEAYQSGGLNLAEIRTVRRVLALRKVFNKKITNNPDQHKLPTASGIVETLKKESHRQKSLIRKTRVCEEKVAFVVGAFSRLMVDEDFLTLLRAEKLDSMPKELSEKLNLNS
ncbi:MAG: ParB/RepB/Spo0J family partition protein [Verrucomicrobiota bacterium]